MSTDAEHLTPMLCIWEVQIQFSDHIVYPETFLYSELAAETLVAVI
jgi:hypothetical protein